MAESVPTSVVITALESLETGDVAGAVNVLLAAMEDGQIERTHRCRVCGLAHEWPGLRSHHELLAHGYDHEYDQLEEAA